ncbi:MAG: RES family NAD+ phosphorylase [Rhodoplanes sp.]|uniref:RES family NAD+ phosphorylase n=1 Tax=Rhodoplanes sp. TaxID=1968906 RepID=UPI0017C6EF21|nr:RES family NAD+ phosphorylase [Rhodoplanes sp.]NVO16614.1 RES family NAD+ phosphorylase [Rhodoplanes sp.]
MSSSTWTPAALSSDAQALSGPGWRLVEAQHHASTLKLVDSVTEQTLLETLIEETKPVLPPECRGLHYLLSTPFRYGAAYPTGSRFRRAGMTEGIFYAAETPATAMAETAFHRLLFFAESPATPWPSNPAEFTAFSVAYAAGRAIDLGRYAAAQPGLFHPTDYGPCQAFAETARAASIEVIRYTSIRDPGHGHNLALLTCRAFASPQPVEQRTWRVHLNAAGVQAICESPKQGLTFDRACFAADPRIAAMVWDRP